MAIGRKYGIYLNWGPANYLHTEGIGRQLASFLKGTKESSDASFVIACPSWGRLQVEELCEAEQVQRDHIEFISPENLPLSLRIYRTYLRRRSLVKKPSRFWNWLRHFRIWLATLQNMIERRLVSTRSLPAMLLFIISFIPIAIIIFILRFLMNITRSATITIKRSITERIGNRKFFKKLVSINDPIYLRRLYQLLEQSETDLLIGMINQRNDIAAWYCPTAFWPQFNLVRGPRLMCVPDVVPAAFPVGFEMHDGEALSNRFCQMQDAIHGASHCVTYSEHVKWQTLVKDYDLRPTAVHVVPHAPNELLQSILVSGTADDEIATNLFSRQMLALALRAAPNLRYAAPFKNEFVQFIFYASQFRPNKNVIMFLRAFEYLLRRRYKGLKLILTGQPEYHEVAEFVSERNLHHDVLFLSNLPLQQLAACYRLARLAVNPSLSEGGFPFTFSEALSVGTPVVMSRIPVTTEIITDPDLQSLMLFDPYDWRDMADRIEWALDNRETLLAKQKPLYDKLSQRTWRHVVDDHIRILDQIAAEDANRPATQ